MFAPIEKIVAWLRAGYPEGIPEGDYIPLVALLRRRMTDDEIAAVGERLERSGLLPADPTRVGAEILRVLDEVPSHDEIQRVIAQLSAGGWAVNTDEPRVPVLGPTVHLFLGPVGSGKTDLARQLAAAGAIRFNLGDWMARLVPDLAPGSDAYEHAAHGVRAFVWETADQVLSSGGDVVLDWNAWSRAERADAVARAGRSGAQVVLHELVPDQGEPASEAEGLRIVRS